MTDFKRHLNCIYRARNSEGHCRIKDRERCPDITGAVFYKGKDFQAVVGERFGGISRV